MPPKRWTRRPRHSRGFEKTLGDAYKYSRDTVNKLELDGPFEAGLSLLSIKGYSFDTRLSGRFSRTGPREFRQNDIEAKPYTVEDVNAPIGNIMKRAFDRVWRGARWSNGSPYFFDNGWLFE